MVQFLRETLASVLISSSLSQRGLSEFESDGNDVIEKVNKRISCVDVNNVDTMDCGINELIVQNRLLQIINKILQWK